MEYTEADIQDLLLETFSKHLKIDRTLINGKERLKNYGLDSGMAMRITSSLSVSLNRSLEQTLLWDHPTINELAVFLAAGNIAQESRSRQGQAITEDEPIAIVGIACRFPGAANKKEFWDLLTTGREAIVTIPEKRWPVGQYYNDNWKTAGKMNSMFGGFIEDVDKFDPAFFGISPREAEQMDPQQRIMLELSWHALEDSGTTPSSLGGSSTGVFFGAIWNDYLLLNEERGVDQITQHTATGTHHSIIANRVSYCLGLQGPSLCIDTACSSSLVAVHLAVNSLRTGESSVTLAGGINLILSPYSSIAMSRLGTLSSDGRCHSFDEEANGYVRGEGAGVIVMKRLSAALEDGDRIYCLIAGTAVNNDGFSNGITAPNPKAQEQVLFNAYSQAGIDPATVRFVETHGTGTFVGDPIEAKSVGRIFSASRSSDKPLFLGAVKTNFGHLEAAAGIAGLIKTALTVHHRYIPPNLNFKRPNPAIPFEKYNLKIPQKGLPWPDQEPAVAGVNSFGFGGTNCHVILKELPDDKPILHLSAGEQGGDDDLLVVKNATGGHDYQYQPSSGRPIVFLFSGQGPQWPGMGKILLRSEPVFKRRLEEIDACFEPLAGWSIIRELNTPRSERWEMQDVVQPLIFAVQLGLATVWELWGIRPDAVIGHSMGEVAAAVTAGMLSLRDGVAVIYNRSRLMEKQAGKGAMLVVGLEKKKLEEYLSKYKDISIAAINSPVSTIVSGMEAGIKGLMNDLEKNDIFCREVLVTVAGHSCQMAPLEEELYESLRHITPRPGRCTMISTVYGKEISFENIDAAYWVRHLSNPVLFWESIKQVLRQEDPVFMELSPNAVLRRSVEEICSPLARSSTVIPSMEKGENEPDTLMNACGALLENGYRPDWNKISNRTAIITGNPPVMLSGHNDNLLVLSAHSPESLSAVAEGVCNILSEETNLDDIVAAMAQQRSHLPYRLAVQGNSVPALLEGLQCFLQQKEHGSVYKGAVNPGRVRKTVFAFSGQYIHWKGMGKWLYNNEAVFREIISEFDAIMKKVETYNWTLAEVILNNNGNDYSAVPEVLQPLICGIQIGLTSCWKHWGIQASAVIGFGIGEAAAAYVAGILSLEEVVTLACKRGKLTAVTGDNNRSGDLDEEFLRAVRQLKPRPSVIPFYSTTKGQLMQSYKIDDSYWMKNLQSDYLFKNTIKTLLEDGFNCILEIPPGPFLQVLDTDGHMLQQTTVLSSMRPYDERVGMLSVLAFYYTNGVDIKWEYVFRRNGRCTDLPAYPFQRESYWIRKEHASIEKDAVSVYPLPGQRLKYPGLSGKISYQTCINLNDQGYFGPPDEQYPKFLIIGVVLEMALTAVRTVLKAGSPLTLCIWQEELAYEHVPEQLMLHIDVVEKADGCSFEISGLFRQNGEYERMITGEATCTVSPLPDHPEQGGEVLAVTTGTVDKSSAACLPPQVLEEVLGSVMADLPSGSSFITLNEIIFVRPLAGPCSYACYEACQDAAGITMNIVLYGEEGAPAAILRNVRYQCPAIENGQSSGTAYTTCWVETVIEETRMSGVENADIKEQEGTAGPLWIVFMNDGGLGRYFADYLSFNGIDHITVFPSTHFEARSPKEYFVHPGKKDHYSQLLEYLISAHPGRPFKLVHFWLFELSRDAVESDNSWIDTLMEGMEALLYLSQGCIGASVDAVLDLAVVSRETQQVTNKDTPHIHFSSAWAFLKVLQTEAPFLHTRILDCDMQSGSFSLLFAGLLFPDEETEVAYRYGKRYINRLRPLNASLTTVAAESKELLLSPDKIYLITGGFGKLGLAMADLLIRRGAKNLALAGRTGGQHVQMELKALREKGAQICSLTVDIANRVALKKCINSLGLPLGGIIHAAGIMDKEAIQDVSWENAMKVLHPKVHGAWNLHILFEGLNLDFFIGISSISALIGFKKLAIYSAANAFLDALAHFRRVRGLAGQTINFGPIEAGMAMNTRLLDLKELKQTGVFTISLEYAMQMMNEHLAKDAVQIVLVNADWRILSNAFPNGAPFLSDLQEQTEIGTIVSSSHEERSKEDISSMLEEIAANVLGTSTPDFNRSLPELGMDSLMIIDFIEEVKSKMNLVVSAAVVYNSASIYEISEKILGSPTKQAQQVTE